MKTNKLLLIIIVTALAVFVLTSFTSNEVTSDNRVVRHVFDGRTFYVLEDYNGKAVGFIEKR
jgi:hypothetical protein